MSIRERTEETSKNLAKALGVSACWPGIASVLESFAAQECAAVNFKLAALREENERLRRFRKGEWGGVRVTHVDVPLEADIDELVDLRIEVERLRDALRGLAKICSCDRPPVMVGNTAHGVGLHTDVCVGSRARAALNPEPAPSARQDAQRKEAT